MKGTRRTREELKTEAIKNEDHFHCLTEELLISIFGKVVDLKCLCQCSLVSRHFASVISHVRTVSVTISGGGTYSWESLRNMAKFVTELNYSNSEQIPTLLDSSSLQNMKLPIFLQNHRELEFIYLEYAYPETGATFPMRKIKLARNSVRMESCVALLPSSIHKDTEDEPDQEPYTSESKKITECFLQFYERYTEWMCFILILVKCHRSLHAVIITDSEIHGKFVIGDEQLANIEVHVMDELLYPNSLDIARVARLPVLRLPLSRYVLRWVALVIIEAPVDPEASAKKLEERTYWDFEDKFPVLYEAIKEILKNHMDKIKTCHILNN